jgi:hypothetical protein
LTRVKYKWGIASLAGLASTVALVASASPAEATLICPPGTANPNYCTNVPPVAVTDKTSPVQSQGATLNGVAGPGIPNGDVTTYFFRWGRSTTYGNTTPPGKVGKCPPGISNPNYCPGVPAVQSVSADIGGLQPCTIYHDQLVSTNPDGTTVGNDRSFVTTFAKPIKRVHVPKRVAAGNRFKVKITTSFTSTLAIFLRFHNHNVKTLSLGSHGPGQITKTIKAPPITGKYVVRVMAKEDCGRQIVDKNLTVF